MDGKRQMIHLKEKYDQILIRLKEVLIIELELKDIESYHLLKNMFS